MKKRGFEIVTAYQKEEINLPKRATTHAAGYDFEAAADVVIPSIWKQLFSRVNGDNSKTKKRFRGLLERLAICKYSSSPI